MKIDREFISNENRSRVLCAMRWVNERVNQNRNQTAKPEEVWRGALNFFDGANSHAFFLLL